MTLSIKARIFSGFGLLLLMLAVSTGVSSVLIGRIERSPTSTAQRKAMPRWRKTSIWS